MPANFPPEPLYPDALDTDYTLFVVHNTVEAVTSADNPPWADEISIRPVSPDKDEIWSDNGFATISGELLYYDTVEKNASNRVTKLKGCVRNLGGETTRFNPAGTDIRSFVIAEHHNQIALDIIAIERYLGTLACDDTNTLICCLEELDVPDCREDGNCPDVTFTFTTDDSNETCQGTVLSYEVSLQGTPGTFRLDFGDGEFTTVPTNGTHTYAPGANIDPVITVKNENCEIVVTGIERENDNEPETLPLDEGWEIPVVVPSIPTFVVPSISVPVPDISIPPIILPTIDLSPLSIALNIGDINVPSIISVIVPSIPNISLIVPNIPDVSLIVPNIPDISLIVPAIPNISIIGPAIPSEIQIIGGQIPSVISVIDDIPSVISVVDDIPSVISLIGDLPSVVSLVGDLPSVISVIDDVPSVISVVDDIPNVISISCCDVSVDWGSVPTLTAIVQVQCDTPVPFAGPVNVLDEGLADDELGELEESAMGVRYQIAGIPDTIVVQVPDIPMIQIDPSGMPTKIVVEAPTIPSEIKIVGVEEMPKEITVLTPSKLPDIKINASSLPESIPIDWGDAPRKIEIEAADLPKVISIEHNIPSTISVEGMVDTITIKGLPDYIPVRFENLDELKQVFRIEPAEVKITLDTEKLITQDDSGHVCFALVPCKP